MNTTANGNEEVAEQSEQTQDDRSSFSNWVSANPLKTAAIGGALVGFAIGMIVGKN